MGRLQAAIARAHWTQLDALGRAYIAACKLTGRTQPLARSGLAGQGPFSDGVVGR
jgi:hypothetical protein